jgi:hypothetical protein
MDTNKRAVGSKEAIFLAIGPAPIGATPPRVPSRDEVQSWIRAGAKAAADVPAAAVRGSLPADVRFR